MKEGAPRILIIRLSAVGDVVRVLPAAHVLRMSYPNARIDWAVERKAADIVQGHPALDTVMVFERSPGVSHSMLQFFGFCGQVRANRYDLVLDFHGSLKSGLIAWLSGADQRVGFARPRGREGAWIFLTKRVKLPSAQLNRVEENLILCEAVVKRRAAASASIHVPADVQEYIDAFYEETFDGGKRVVAMHTPVDREEKRWPTAHFAALADKLLADGRFEVLLTWGPGQFHVVEDVLSRTRRHPVVAPETSDLKQYAWLVHRADLYFGPDTGPMHIASVMGTPVVAVFGGTDPAKHAPLRKPYEILWAGLDAEQTTASRRLGVRQRLERITPDMAYDACIRIAFNSRQE